MKHSVKLFGLLFFFCINCFVLKAQQKHFIYVQSEDKQPFAIVLNGKVYSSSDYGYVIIPKLIDSTYNFTVSFPMNKFPDQAFTCSINKKDAGYILKSETDGWALQNMQTQKLVMNSTAVVAQKNAFGDMLSDVVSDSDLTKTTIAEQRVDTANTVAGTFAAIQATDSAAAENTGFITDSIAQLEKISESKLDTGTNMLFVDKTQNGVDTISVFIPADTDANLTTEQQSLPENKTTGLQNESAVVLVPLLVNDSSQNNTSANPENVTESATKAEQDTITQAVANPFYKSEQNNNNPIVDPNSNLATQTAIISVSNAVKEDCDNMISDEDLNKLKRKMFLQGNNNDMIRYAIKFMNKKCITTDQVKSLGNLFSSDDGRYSLYDALYNYVYDYGNYPLLASQIVDPYYKKRFTALLR